LTDADSQQWPVYVCAVHIMKTQQLYWRPLQIIHSHCRGHIGTVKVSTQNISVSEILPGHYSLTFVCWHRYSSL